MLILCQQVKITLACKCVQLNVSYANSVPGGHINFILGADMRTTAQPGPLQVLQCS